MGKAVEKVIEENIYFADISPEYIEKTKQNLQKLTGKEIKRFNEIADDFCFHNFDEKFDFIIGNPPYVRIQNLNGRKEQLQKSFITASNGSIDLCFCFFEQALKLLKENGKISFITPNSHFYSAAGKNLRNLMLPHLVKIINFDHFQVFKNATTYTEMVAKLFLLQFYLFGCVIVRLRKMLFAVAGLRPQNILLVFLASFENLKFRYEIVLQPSQCILTKKSLFEIFRPKCSYKTLVVNLIRFSSLALIILFVLLKINHKKASLIKHTDSTDVPVCLPKNAKRHQTMKFVSNWAKTGKGWFYGLKLHLTTDLKRKLLSFKFISGNIHDTKVFMDLNKNLEGIFVADAGYCSDKLSREFYQEGKRILFTKPKKNMKKIITAWQFHLYNTRMTIEFSIRDLKMFNGLITSLPRSMDGYLANYIYSLLSCSIS